MIIRNANYKDAASIKFLMEALGYKSSVSFLVDQLEMVFGVNNNELFVYEVQKEVIGFASVHFFPQLGFNGEIAYISYLRGNDSKSQFTEKKLEEHICRYAYKRKCDRIELRRHDFNTTEHQFYLEQGYELHTNLYTKKLIYGE